MSKEYEEEDLMKYYRTFSLFCCVCLTSPNDSDKAW